MVRLASQEAGKIQRNDRSAASLDEITGRAVTGGGAFTMGDEAVRGNGIETTAPMKPTCTTKS